MAERSNKIGDEAAAAQFNKMMNQDNYQSLPFNPILHKFNSKRFVSASKEADSKKTSWKNRNFLKVKINEIGGRVFNENEVPPAIRYISSEEIKERNSNSAYNPIQFQGNKFSLPTAYRKRPRADPNHTVTVCDQNYRDSKAIQEYNREVSKRVNVLKNKANRFFARYEFDKKLKSLECLKSDKHENINKNKLSFLREKELKRGYDILTMESHFIEPKREPKISYVTKTFPEKERRSIDGYKPGVVESVWDKINRSEYKSSNSRMSRLENMKSSHSVYSNHKDMSTRQNIIKSSCSIKSNLAQSKRYDRSEIDSKRIIRENLQNNQNNYYVNNGMIGSNRLTKNAAVSRSHNTIEINNSNPLI